MSFTAWSWQRWAGEVAAVAVGDQRATAARAGAQQDGGHGVHPANTSGWLKRQLISFSVRT